MPDRMKVNTPLDGCGLIVWSSRRVHRGATNHPLTRLEARLLAHLVLHAERVVDRTELLQEVWGYPAAVQTRTVESTIRRLRQKIERDPGEPKHILSVYGQGYRFVGAVAAPEPLSASDQRASA
jgi:DNA-binding response OmpR family regulator